MSHGRVCFVVMPFRPELNFFYLYIQRHLQDKHGLQVRRGDTSVLTKALMEKLEAEILDADLIVGDVTYPNPNVFYELGIARANRKPIIFLTQEEPEKAPVDLRQFEFIKYDLSKEVDLLSKLDNAVRNALGQGHQELYSKALRVLQEFNGSTSSNYGAAPYEEFQARVMRGQRTEGIPEGAALREFLLPKVISEATDIAAIRKMESWLSDAKTKTRPNRRLQPSAHGSRGTRRG